MRTLFRAVAPLLFLTSVLASQAPDPTLTEGLRLLEEGRTTLEQPSLASAKEYFARLTPKDAANSTYWYQLARVDRYLVESYASRGDKKSAEQALDDGISAVQRSISLNDQSADAHSLLADLYGRKIGLAGFFAGIHYGPKVSDENKRALALDGNNPGVHASLGRQYLMAPRMFGGDLDKALEEFRRSTQLDPTFDENFVWLAIACRKKGDAPCADKALQEAFRLNPRSAFAKHTSWQK